MHIRQSGDGVGDSVSLRRLHDMGFLPLDPYLIGFLEEDGLVRPEDDLTYAEKHAVRVALWYARCLTSKEVAAAAGVSVKTLHAWGNVKRSLRPGPRLKGIAEFLRFQAKLLTRAADWIQAVAEVAEPVKRGAPSHSDYQGERIQLDRLSRSEYRARMREMDRLEMPDEIKASRRALWKDHVARMREKGGLPPIEEDDSDV